MLVDFANAMVFQFNNHGFSAVTSNIAITATQPLIRGAFARFRTQALSLQERQTLYALRNFARFRRQFFVNVVAGNGFLSLVETIQNIRNQEEQVRSLARNLEEQEELVKAGAVAQKDRDAIAQQYQGRPAAIGPIARRTSRPSSTYTRSSSACPPRWTCKVDESLLKIFELYDPALDALRKRSEDLFLALLQPEEAPPNPVLLESAAAAQGPLRRSGDDPRAHRGGSPPVAPAPGPGRQGERGTAAADPPPGKDPDEAEQIELSTRLARGLRETRDLIDVRPRGPEQADRRDRTSGRRRRTGRSSATSSASSSARGSPTSSSPRTRPAST